MVIHFSKMHGLGNDFVVIDGVTQNLFLSPEKVRKLADRHRGIGFDQLLFVEPPYDPEQDFHYRIFNADGSEVTQCGNGARCFARFVKMRGLTNRNKIRVSTKSGKMTLYIEKDDLVTVNMGVPDFSPGSLPLQANKQEKTYLISLQERTIMFGAVSMGNPHCLLDVNDIKRAEVDTLGPVLATHERFPQGVNVGFMQVIAPDTIKLRVYERGVGETQACGSGACAAVAIGQIQGKLDKDVDVSLPGGHLRIRWNGPGNALKMTGPAEHVFDGQLQL